MHAPARLLLSLAIGPLLLAACEGPGPKISRTDPTEIAVPPNDSIDDVASLADQIEVVVSKDAIPAIDEPRFWTADEADRHYRPDELIIGLDLDGEARAYSIPFLSEHEIVNDSLKGRPISVTW